MSEEEFKELKKKHEIFRDVWDMCRKHAKKGPQEWDWEEILSDVDRLTKEYKCELCYALCHAVLEEFERMETAIQKKEAKKNGRCEMD